MQTGLACLCTLQDFVVKHLQRIPGVKLPEPEGAFYALPDMTSFFGPGVEADDFGSIPDVDTLCRQVHAAGAYFCAHSVFSAHAYVGTAQSAALGM